MRGSGVIRISGAILSIVGCGSLLAACSGAPATKAAHYTHTAVAAVSSGGYIDVCAIFSVKEAARTSGIHLTASRAGYTSGPGMYSCSYTHGAVVSDADADEDNPDVVVYTTGNPTTLATLKASLDASATPGAPTEAVPGVGDEAYVGYGGIAARFGQRLLRIDSITADRSGDHSGTIAMAKAAIAAIDTAAPQS